MRRNSNQKAKVKGPRQNPRKQKGATRRSSATAPPSFIAVPIRQGKVRFIATGAVNGSFTTDDLLNLPGVLAATAVLGMPIAQAVRLKGVEAWCPIQTAGSTVEINLIDSGGAATVTTMGGVPSVHTGSSMSFDKPAHVKWQAPKNKVTGSWWSAFALASGALAGSDLFTLVCPLGTVIDVIFDYIINLDAFAVTIQPPTRVFVAATPGQLYNRVAITNLTPQGVSVI